MNTRLGILVTMVIMLVASSYGYVPCRQPLEIRNNRSVLVHERRCNQTVDQEDLQVEPEILYHDFLPVDHRYILFLLENMNSSNYQIHWIIKDITPMNRSLTANKTVLMGYSPPKNNNTATYAVMIYKQPSGFQLYDLSFFDMKNFIPERWAQSIRNLSLEYNGLFFVNGRNSSQGFPSSSTEYHTPVHPQLPSQPHTPNRQPPYSTFLTPSSSSVTPTTLAHEQFSSIPHITHRPGYNASTNSTNITSIPKRPSSSHPNKSGASNNIIGLIVIITPIINISLRLMY